MTAYAARFVAQRFALLGDAAVGMHPTTAHGFNFGLLGQHALATAIRAARKLDRGRVHRHAQRFDAATMIDRYEDVLQRMAARPLVLADALHEAQPA